MSKNSEVRDDTGLNPTFYHKRILIPHNRRSTMIFSNVEGGVELYENPNNPDHVNASLRREYETVKELNAVLENVIDNVEGVANMVGEYAKTVDRTETILNMWTQILTRAEHTKATIEANLNPPPIFKKPEPVRNKSSGTSVKRRRIFRSQR